MTPDVSVVIPAHNEARAVGDVVRRSLASHPRVFEVVVVDDGSIDATSDVAREAGARIVRLDVNGGKGHAMQRGIAASSGDVLVFIDADGQDDPGEIRLLLEALGPGVAMVNGSRFIGQFRPGAITRTNRLGTRFLTSVLNLLFHAQTTDCLAGFRAVRRSTLDQISLAAGGYDIEVDMLVRVIRSGGKVVDVPVTRSPRPHGESGLSNLKDGTRILARLVRLRLTS